MSNQCPACGSDTVREEARPYHFTQSGLNNVWISNAPFLVCEKCGERTIRIPNPVQLIKCIGEAVVSIPGLLTGKEIKFLRKSLFLKGMEFANLIGVSRETVSRWENGVSTPDVPNDRLIRLTYANMIGLPDRLIKELLHRFQMEDSDQRKTKSKLDYLVNVQDQGDSYGCSLNC